MKISYQKSYFYSILLVVVFGHRKVRKLWEIKRLIITNNYYFHFSRVNVGVSIP